MAENRQDLLAVADSRWHSCRHEPGAAVWTDDFSNLLGALELG